MRKPKDIDNYLPSIVAGCRLINLALENILYLRKGIRVKWELKLSYYRDPAWAPAPGQVAILQGVTYKSGKLVDNAVDMEGIDAAVSDQPDPPMTEGKV